MSTPRWLADDPATLDEAISLADKLDNSRSDIVSALAAHWFGDVSERRIDAIVERTLDRDGSTTLDTPDDLHRSSDDDPRSLETRYVDITDITYLSNREFARVLGLTLTRFEGRARPALPSDDVVVDLFWNRQSTTAAVRIAVKPDGTVVDEDLVREVAEGSVEPASGRSPSTVAVVTNTAFTEAARDSAAAADIEVCSGSHVQYLLDLCRVSPEVFGRVLEKGEDTETAIEDVAEELPALPDSIAAMDPLSLTPPAAAGTQVKPDADGTMSHFASASSPDENAVSDGQPGDRESDGLHADPDHDGDYSALDKIANELAEKEDQQ